MYVQQQGAFKQLWGDPQDSCYREMYVQQQGAFKQLWGDPQGSCYREMYVQQQGAFKQLQESYRQQKGPYFFKRFLCIAEVLPDSRFCCISHNIFLGVK